MKFPCEKCPLLYQKKSCILLSWKEVRPRRISYEMILISLLPAGYTDALGGACLRGLPSGNSDSILNVILLYLSLCFPFLVKVLPRKHCWSRIRLSIFRAFVLQCQERPSQSLWPTLEGKYVSGNHRGYNCITRKGMRENFQAFPF